MQFFRSHRYVWTVAVGVLFRTLVGLSSKERLILSTSDLANLQYSVVDVNRRTVNRTTVAEIQGNDAKCIVEFDAAGMPTLARHFPPDHPGPLPSYELCLRAAGGEEGPHTPFGMCVPVETETNSSAINSGSVVGTLPKLSEEASTAQAALNLTLALRQVWQHEEWDYSKTESCEGLWVDEVVCEWSVIVANIADSRAPLTRFASNSTVAKAAAEVHLPLPPIFFSAYDSVIFFGDSTVRRLFDAFRGRCKAFFSHRAGNRTDAYTFEVSPKLRTDKSEQCGNLLIIYVVNMGDRFGSLKNLPVRPNSLVVFNLAHTYMWYNEVQMAPVVAKITETIKAKAFPNAVFLHAPAINTKFWVSNNETDAFRGYGSRCTHNNVMVKKRHQEALRSFAAAGVDLPVVNVYYESLAARPQCATDGVHYCPFVYNLMVDRLLEIEAERFGSR